jgi:hypothetical protein
VKKRFKHEVPSGTVAVMAVASKKTVGRRPLNMVFAVICFAAFVCSQIYDQGYGMPDFQQIP